MLLFFPGNELIFGVYMSTMAPPTKAKIGRRRSKRLLLSVPVIVYGRTADNHAFRDTTGSLSVNLHGGLLAIAAPVQKGQTIVVVNRTTREEQECRAVYLGPIHEGRRNIGIEFTGAAPNFWKVHFPPLEPTAPLAGAA